MRKQRKGNGEIAFGIIALALLFLLGGIFIQNPNSPPIKFPLLNQTNNSNYLFSLNNNTVLGKQQKIIDNFPNFNLGSKKEYKTLYIGNDFSIKSNAFYSNNYSFYINLNNFSNTKQILLYFNLIRNYGNYPILIDFNNKTIYNGILRSQDIPIIINPPFIKLKNKISIKIKKPSWFMIFSSNKISISNLKVISQYQKGLFNSRNFNFQILNSNNLENVYMNLAIKCFNIQDNSAPIKVLVNDFIISNSNPDCIYSNSRANFHIPLNILKKDNTLHFFSNGFYDLAYSINKIYYNNKTIYNFNINNFQNLYEIVMFGNFNKPSIVINLNGHILTLFSNRVLNIIPYIKFGENTLQFLTLPISFKNFYIQQNQYLN